MQSSSVVGLECHAIAFNNTLACVVYCHGRVKQHFRVKFEVFSGSGKRYTVGSRCYERCTVDLTSLPIVYSQTKLCIKDCTPSVAQQCQISIQNYNRTHSSWSLFGKRRLKHCSAYWMSRAEEVCLGLYGELQEIQYFDESSGRTLNYCRSLSGIQLPW